MFVSLTSSLQLTARKQKNLRYLSIYNHSHCDIRDLPSQHECYRTPEACLKFFNPLKLSTSYMDHSFWLQHCFLKFSFVFHVKQLID